MAGLKRGWRRAFTLLEMLVAVGIISILVGLLLAAIQKVRASAARIEATNNLHQIGMASFHCQEASGRLPPGYGVFPGGPGDPTVIGGICGYGNVFFHLLPYIEQGNLYNITAEPGSGPPGHTGTIYTPFFPLVRSMPVKVYLNPSDPSMSFNGRVHGSTTHAEGWGACGFAFNAQIFCRNTMKGQFVDWWNNARIPDSIPDGASTTILFTEKLSLCGKPGTQSGGASSWSAGPAEESMPVFSVSNFPTWTYPPPAGAFPTGPFSHFQAAPFPNNTDRCHYWLPTSPRPEGILVCLADASVRHVAVGVSSQTWWAACTPAGKDQLGPDW